MAIFIISDLFFVGVLLQKTLKDSLSEHLAARVNWYAVPFFYFIYILGIFTFVVYPAHAKQSYLHALTYGAIFGLCCYATYEFTNLATLKNWPLHLVIIDLLWGISISAFISYIGFVLLEKFS